MLRKITLVGVMLLLAGCMAHITLARFEAVGPAAFRQGNKTFRVYLNSTSRGTPHGNFAERTSAALYYRHREMGPYRLKVFVTTDDTENGTQISLTSATLSLSAGRHVELLAKGDPAVVAVTEQVFSPNVKPDKSSRCSFEFGVPETLVFQTGDTVRVNLTFQIAGEPGEFPVTVEFRHEKSDQWIPTPAIM